MPLLGDRKRRQILETPEELEYDQDMISLLEAVWGEGFMSPGGTEEIDRVLGDKDLREARVLDIGCGIGGAAVHIALTRHPEASPESILKKISSSCLRHLPKRMTSRPFVTSSR